MAPQNQTSARATVARMALLVSSAVLSILGVALMGLGAAKPQYGAILAGNEARPEGAKGAAPGGAAVAFGFLAAVVGGNGVYGAWKMSRSALLCYHVAATVLIIGLLYSASLALLYRSAAIDILRSGSGEGDEKGGIEDAEASLRGLGASFIASFVLLLITLVAGAEVMGWRFTLSRLGGATHFAGVLSGILLLTLCAALAGWKEYKVKDAVTIDMSISPKPKVDPLIDDTTRVFNATMDGVTPGAVWFHRDSLSFPDGSISFTVSFFGVKDCCKGEKRQDKFIGAVKDAVKKYYEEQMGELTVQVGDLKNKAKYKFGGLWTASFLAAAGAFSIAAGVIGMVGATKSNARALCCHLSMVLPLVVVLIVGAAYASKEGERAASAVERRWESIGGDELPPQNIALLLSANMRTAAALGSLLAVLLFSSLLHSALALLVAVTGRHAYSPVDAQDEEEVVSLNESSSPQDGALDRHRQAVEAKRREMNVELQGYRRPPTGGDHED